MRVLLRNCRTKLYYVGQSPHGRLKSSGAADWQALDFGNVHSAAKFTLEEDLPDMEIVLRYDSCDGEVALPVLPDWCLPREAFDVARQALQSHPKATSKPHQSVLVAR